MKFDKDLKAEPLLLMLAKRLEDLECTYKHLFNVTNAIKNNPDLSKYYRKKADQFLTYYKETQSYIILLEDHIKSKEPEETLDVFHLLDIYTHIVKMNNVNQTLSDCELLNSIEYQPSQNESNPR